MMQHRCFGYPGEPSGHLRTLAL